MTKQKVIFTADDYGPVKAINEGVIQALKAGAINSVEIFANHDNFDKSINLLKKECESIPFEIGCHLTITSGKPLTDTKDHFVRSKKLSGKKKGYFRSYLNLSRPKDNSSIQEELKLLKNELDAQVKKLKKNSFIGGRLTHISTHHNTLFLFEDYLEVYLAVAKENNLNVRSPIANKFKKHKTYVHWILNNHLLDLPVKHRKKMRKFVKSLQTYVKNLPPIPAMPVNCYNMHYGPIP